jgi:hypothetical protein
MCQAGFRIIVIDLDLFPIDREYVIILSRKRKVIKPDLFSRILSSEKDTALQRLF